MFICYRTSYEGGCKFYPDEPEYKGVKHYLNLTNGIEFLEDSENINFNFVRIQSCACERHLWDKIILDLDYHFLLDIALGYKVIVYDTSAKKEESRAMFQGLKFIEYVLNRVWFNKKIDIEVKGMNCKKYFEEGYRELSNISLKKIKYLRKFLDTDKICLLSVCKNTKHDGDYKYYKQVLLENY